MKRLHALLSLLIVVALVSGCIFGDDDKDSNSGSNALIGTWVYVKNDSEGHIYRTSLTFNNDGTCRRNYHYLGSNETDEGTYTVSENIVALTFRDNYEEYVDKYVFSISGKTLTLKDVYSDYSIEYTKS